MKELVSCLCPTFNRFSNFQYLIEESVHSFLIQDYENKELILCNDTPGQKIIFSHPNVKVFNLDKRFETLSDKLIWMIQQSSGDILCRWDDDDISLTHRLSYSVNKLGDKLEWRCENYWFNPSWLSESIHPANVHAFGIFRKKVLDIIGGYPEKHCGTEDIEFVEKLIKNGFPKFGDKIPQEDIYYLYRWATGSRHISGGGGNKEDFCQRYKNLENTEIKKGEFELNPRWHENYTEKIRQKLSSKITKTNIEEIGGYFDWHELYKNLIKKIPNFSKFVEVGNLNGKSLIFLAQEAKKVNKKIQIIGVDNGVGVVGENNINSLLKNIKDYGVDDLCDIIVSESTRASKLFNDESIDMIFLDAGHEKIDILSDLQCWYPKVKINGWIGGHDYNHCYFPYVKDVVDAFFNKTCESQLSKTCWEYTKTKDSKITTSPILKTREKPIKQEKKTKLIKPTIGVPSILEKKVKFSLVMPCFDDFEGVEMTIQMARLMHHHRIHEIVVVNNNPDKNKRPKEERKNKTGHSENTEHICDKVGATYIEFTDVIGTAAAKNHAVMSATTDYVICTDSHNKFALGSFDALGEYYEKNPNASELIHGPCATDCLTSCFTHFTNGWGDDDVFGQWAFSKEKFEAGEPFEIEAIGMGAFAIKKEYWQGWHPLLRGFGGEERFINLRHKRKGYKTICHPKFIWQHRWGRGNGVGYPYSGVKDRARNAIIGFLDLGLDIDRCKYHFTKERKNPISEEEFGKIYADTKFEFDIFNQNI